MKRRDLIKKLEKPALYLKDMGATMIFIKEEMKEKKFQDIKKSMIRNI